MEPDSFIKSSKAKKTWPGGVSQGCITAIHLEDSVVRVFLDDAIRLRDQRRERA